MNVNEYRNYAYKIIDYISKTKIHCISDIFEGLSNINRSDFSTLVKFLVQNHILAYEKKNNINNYDYKKI